jgi:hypothetical protein
MLRCESKFFAALFCYRCFRFNAETQIAMDSYLNRRRFIRTSTAAGAALLLPHHLLANGELANVPLDNPAKKLTLGWTGELKWDHVVDVSQLPGDGKYDDARVADAQTQLLSVGGGVVYFPPGEYRFANDIKIEDGVVLRGATPTKVTQAHDANYAPASRFEFPKYEPTFQGSGTPIDTAFKGIQLADPGAASNCGIVNIAINRGHVHLGETDDKRCGTNRIVFGCLLRNTAVADAGVPTTSIRQHAWQRFTARHHAAIDVKSQQNVLVANNRLPESGDDNFVMPDFLLNPKRGSKDRYDVVFDYDNRPGIYVNQYCVGGAGGSGEDGTAETHPWGFRKGTTIRDNYIFHTGRIGIGFGGDGTVCAYNVTRLKKDIWRPTCTGVHASTGSSTNDNRAVQMRGWRWIVEGNDCEVYRNWCADKSYLINDGEGLMHEDHCNSDIRDSRLTNNRVNSYLSIYKCGPIDGLRIEGNDVSVPGDIADIYVVATRNSGNQPCHNVSIIGNVTRSNGILLKGAPATGNVIRGNVHKASDPGYLKNEANAKVTNNKNYG